jgi:predicted ATP-dependent Lon-type protease
MFHGNGKFDRTGFGSDREYRETPYTAFSFLKANGNRIGGTITKVDELANTLQVHLDSGAKRVLLPIISIGALGTVPNDLVGRLT